MKCRRCGQPGHTRDECTPPPCAECGGVESHTSERCSVWQSMAKNLAGVVEEFGLIAGIAALDTETR